MSVGRWVCGVLVAASVAVVAVIAWPRLSPVPATVEVSSAARPSTPAPDRARWSSDDTSPEVLGAPSSQRARTLAAEDALAERSEHARSALIQRQTRRLQRLLESAGIEDNPARARILRRRLDDLERLTQEPSE